MRRPVALLCAVALVIALAGPAAAGGWATIEPDDALATAGVTIATDFGFTVLQHGETPAGWVTATFVATNVASGATIEAPARREGKDGHFVVTLAFPEPGVWTWEIQLAELETDSAGTMTVLATGGSMPTLDLPTVTGMLQRVVVELENQLDAALQRVDELEQRLSQLEAHAASAVR